MAKLRQSPLCHSRNVAPISSSSSSSSLSPSLPFAAGFSFASCRTRLYSRHHLTIELLMSSSKSRAWIPQAHTQLQDRSSTAPDEGIKWWERDLGATLADVKSLQELTDIVADAQGKLVIVEFFASWCGSCRALYPKLCRLAKEHQNIVFVKVNFDENRALCKSLNIKVLPYFHFYRGKLEQLDSFSCSITKLQKLKDAITKYGAGD